MPKTRSRKLSLRRRLQAAEARIAAEEELIADAPGDDLANDNARVHFAEWPDDELPGVAPDAPPVANLEPPAVAEPEGKDQALEAAPIRELGFDEEPPFDPPDEDDEIFGGPHFGGALAPLALDVAPRADVLSESAMEPPPRDRQVIVGPAAPPIAIFASWDRSETAETLRALADDPRMARADISIERGGLDGAIARYAGQAAPNVLVIDTTLRPAEIIEGVDRLRGVIAQGAKIVILGSTNDIRLLRDLEARGVTEYIVPPISGDALASALCALYARADESKVIAIIGARGGAGASTIAHNIAWSIAERQETGVTLIDLDLPFGTIACGFEDRAAPVDIWRAPEDVDEETLERIAAKPTRHLRILTAPAALDQTLELDGQALEALITRVRRTSPVVVLDLPHAWNAWVKQSLITADEVIVAARPDLASLRDAKNLVDFLRAGRESRAAPRVALSMTGAPKRPEISLKDFSQALGIEPAATLAFEPELFGLAAMEGRMIAEAAPRSRAAATLDALAAALTGREPVRRRTEKAREPVAAPSAPVRDVDVEENPDLAEGFAQFGDLEPAAETAPLELVHEAAQAQMYLAKARDAALLELRVQQSPEGAQSAPRRKTNVAMWAAADVIAPLFLAAALYAQDRNHAPPAPPEPHVVVAAPVDQPGRLAFAEELLRVGRTDEALTLLRRTAEGGFVPAQYRLAKIYEHGEGAPADLAAARRWTERAAAGGDRRAMHDLGVYFARGEGAPLDEAAAYRWFRQAAERGVADSQFNLGVLYEQGRGVEANPEDALFWFLVAAQNNGEGATARAERIEARLTPLQIEQAQARADAFRARTTPAPSNGT